MQYMQNAHEFYSNRAGLSALFPFFEFVTDFMKIILLSLEFQGAKA